MSSLLHYWCKLCVGSCCLRVAMRWLMRSVSQLMPWHMKDQVVHLDQLSLCRLHPSMFFYWPTLNVHWFDVAVKKKKCVCTGPLHLPISMSTRQMLSPCYHATPKDSRSVYPRTLATPTSAESPVVGPQFPGNWQFALGPSAPWYGGQPWAHSTRDDDRSRRCYHLNRILGSNVWTPKMLKMWRFKILDQPF